MAFSRPGEFPAGQSAVIGANVRALRLRRRWSQSKIGELMGWPSSSTVCRAEGYGGRQRKFTAGEARQLAVIFGITLEQLTSRCANCGGQPKAGFACLQCGTYVPLGSKAPARPS